MFVVDGVDNFGLDCWSRCGSKQGPCAWCGNNGICCTQKPGWNNTDNGCNGNIGGFTKHECVKNPRGMRNIFCFLRKVYVLNQVK